MSKLTRATVPMCGKCEGEMIENVAKRGSFVYRCLVCGDNTYGPRYWGYYPVDVAGVVTDLRFIAKSWREMGQEDTADHYDGMADRLEGKDAEANHERPQPTS
ncbi:hypothetical protein LCGC14_0259490 [marine sediment metagenome]|uniref:Uncharacterized protein n=1 Tax=marine sediment metagenome TaxID=412755 RepID=A0A0F9U7B1_9ZZZZ